MSYVALPFSKEVGKPAIVEIGASSSSGTPDWHALWRRDFPRWIDVDLPVEATTTETFGVIDAALAATASPVIILCRAEACGQFAEWVASRPWAAWHRIDAALLIAPAAGRGLPFDAGQAHRRMPFLSAMIASRDSALASHGQMRQAAVAWGSQIVDGGDIGDAAQSPALGDWAHGRHVLDWLVQQVIDHRLAQQRVARALQRSSCRSVRS
jgi:predicted alpha/beta hydrolase family esterase